MTFVSLNFELFQHFNKNKKNQGYVCDFTILFKFIFTFSSLLYTLTIFKHINLIKLFKLNNFECHNISHTFYVQKNMHESRI